MKRRLSKITFIIALALSVSLYASDSFNSAKDKYATAAMVQLDVDIVVISDIFGESDITHSKIAIADDGRYSARFNDDIYLFDGHCIWEYSHENNQASKKCLEDNEYFENELVFIKNLNRYYWTTALIPDSLYELKKNDNHFENLPDSMKVYLSKKNIVAIEYYDYNDDLNRIYLKKDKVSDKIDSDLFKINLPDTVEIISMP